MNFSDQNLKLIAKLLDKRGFVLDYDIPENGVSQKNFARKITEQETKIRAYGYKGGKLTSWTTHFQVMTPGYGVFDSDKIADPDEILEYCEIIDNGLRAKNIDINNLIKFYLGVKFHCPKCDRFSVVSPKALNKFHPDRYDKITGKCTSCDTPKLSHDGLGCII